MAIIQKPDKERLRDARWWIRLWEFAIRPNPAITEVGERRQAQSLLILAMAFAVLLSMGLTMAFFLSGMTEVNPVMLVLFITSLIAYGVGRTQFFTWGAFLLVIALPVLVHIQIVLRGETDPAGALYFTVPLALIAGSVFFPVRVQTVLVVVNALAAFWVLVVMKNFLILDAARTAGNLLVMGMMFIGVSLFRNSLEKMRLEQLRKANESLAEAQTDLERRVVERTARLEQHSNYLAASARVAQNASLMLEGSVSLRDVVALIQVCFSFYYVGLYLLDEEREWLVLQAGTGDAGRLLLSRGHRISAREDSIMNWCIENARPRIVLRSETDMVRATVPELLAVRSETILPLRSRGQVLGILTVQSDREDVFNEDVIALLQSMADQIAVTLDNVALLEKSQAALEAERRIASELNRETWLRLLRGRTEIGYRYEDQAIQPAENEWTPEMVSAIQTASVTQGEDAVSSVLAIPLFVRGQPVGVMRVSKDKSNALWSEEETALLTTVAEQLGVALESARLYQDTQRRAARERLISQVTARMRESLDVEMVLSTAVQELVQSLDLPEVIIRMAPSLQE
ncbi:MAG: GAF domain-containing protein [Anaerolineae bacterium]|nr:GAF domain-containing protein [Anaerolineae bacterium]